MKSVIERCSWGGLLLGCLVLGASGCTDHGPVGIYGKELFNKDIAPPHLSFSSASQLTFSAGSVGATNPVLIYLVNDGGSATYGPVLVTFSTADPNMKLVQVNGVTQAIFANSQGQEIPANHPSQTIVGAQGYKTATGLVPVDGTCSLRFWYAVSDPSYKISSIQMQIDDFLGNSWTGQFDVTVVN